MDEVASMFKKQRKKRKKDDFKVKYIGKTKKRGYERGKDHMRQLKSLDERSHLLKHLVEKHPELTIDEFRFGMRVIRN